MQHKGQSRYAVLKTHRAVHLALSRRLQCKDPWSRLGVFTFGWDFYPNIPSELGMLWEPRVDSCLKQILCPCSGEASYFGDRQHISQSCTPSHRRALLGHISVCIHLTNTPALREIHYVLSWQSSKHSRDVFRGFVFPVFTKRLGQSAVRHRMLVSTMAAVKSLGSSTEEQRTQAEKGS